MGITETDTDTRSVFKSEAFRLEELRSETTRIAWIIGVLIAVFALLVFRSLFFGLPKDRHLLLLAIPVLGSAIVYEAIVLALVRRRLQAKRPLPDWTWHVSVVIESLFPSWVLLILTLNPWVGPYHALVVPAVYFYFFAIILSTLRLRPWLSVLVGLVSAGGYLALTVFTFLTYPPGQQIDQPFDPTVYGMGAAMLLLGSLIAAAVADRIRCHVAHALTEAQQRHREHVEARNTLIFGLAKLAEYRDTDTGAHLERISTYAALLANALRNEFEEINDQWVETLKTAASMHDIGKVGIPDAVLCKPGRLTEDERKTIQKHPNIGSETLLAIQQRQGEDPLLVMSWQIAIGHHERWDGGGYPNGLVGDQITLAARIISVADVYDALTSKRVYKPALTHEEACRIIVEGSGSQFDAVVVDALARIADRFDEIRGRYIEEGERLKTEV